MRNTRCVSGPFKLSSLFPSVGVLENYNFRLRGEKDVWFERKRRITKVLSAVLARQVFRVDGNKLTEIFLIVISRQYVSANLCKNEKNG